MYLNNFFVFSTYIRAPIQTTVCKFNIVFVMVDTIYICYQNMCSSLNDEAAKMNRVVKQCQQSQSWLNSRMKKLDKLMKNIQEFKDYVESNGLFYLSID